MARLIQQKKWPPPSRPISSTNEEVKNGREAAPSEVRKTRKPMKTHYDFSNGRRGSVLKVAPGKTRVTIRLDDDVLEWLRQQVDEAGGGNYQTLINEALHNFIANKSA